MPVNPAVEAILNKLHAPKNETQAAFEWVAERFDLARNMGLALATLQSPAAEVRRA